MSFQGFPDASPKPYKKSIVTTLMEPASFRSTPSFKEDTYFISNLKPSENEALQELKLKLKSSISSECSSSMWGVSLFGGDDEKADVILLKFLRARDFSGESNHERGRASEGGLSQTVRPVEA